MHHSFFPSLFCHHHSCWKTKALNLGGVGAEPPHLIHTVHVIDVGQSRVLLPMQGIPEIG